MTDWRQFCDETFPFLIEVDQALHIRRLGRLAQRLFPHTQVGDPLAAILRLRAPEPASYARLHAAQRRGVVMESTAPHTPVLLRGTWQQPAGSEHLLFLGWPWVVDDHELAALGLTLTDLPAHMPLADMLLLLRTSRNTLADSRELSDRLHQRTLSLRQLNSDLERLAHFDPLTQLPNRVLLGDRLQQGIAQAQRRGTFVAVAYMDLDGFKAVNDQYGHDAGDQLLTTMAARLKEMLREGDTLARIGGDEFVAVLCDLAAITDAAPVFERLLAAARQPLVLPQGTVQVSASLGVTYYPLDAVDADMLMRHADQAMYQAKQGGKNQWLEFDVQREHGALTLHERQEEFRLALQSHQLVLYYQPLVDVNRHTVLGVEALVRWQHPVRGLLQPAEFLPLIQDHPLAFALDEWVLRTALAQLRAWQQDLRSVTVAVNVHPVHLQSERFVPMLQAALRDYADVSAHQLFLEIVESHAIADLQRAQAALRQCAALGVRTTLDDFGSGYSSLMHLSKLKVNTLKIDRQFVADLLERPDSTTIVAGIIAIAGAIGCKVVAEGIESDAQAEALVEMGCYLGQGYWIAPPMQATELLEWIRRYEAPPA